VYQKILNDLIHVNYSFPSVKKETMSEITMEPTESYYVGDVKTCLDEEELIEISFENELIESIENIKDFNEKVEEEVTETIKSEMKASNKINCTHCGLLFSANGLYHHIQRTHIISYKFSCDLCGKKFNLKNDLREHMVRHLSPDSRVKHKCQNCHSLFLSLGALKNHEHIFHSDIVEVHLCELCMKTFASRIKYQQHYKTVHQKGNFLCTFGMCTRQYLTKNALNKHIAKNHSRQEACEICGKLVAVGVYMKQHILSHSEKQMKCNQCEKSFLTKSAFNNHMEISHKNLITKHNCSLCPSIFPSIRHLNRHCARQHNNVWQKYWLKLITQLIYFLVFSILDTNKM
jgi:Zinc finger, C2H2 type